MASETGQKLLFVVLLGAVVGGIAYCKRVRSASVTPKPVKTDAPSVVASAPPITGAPVDRVVEHEIPALGCSQHQFGEALAAVGDTLFVGAPYRDYAMQHGDDVPTACLYRGEGKSWSLTQKLSADEPRRAEGYGRSVAVGDSFAVVGAAGHENGDGPTHDYSRSASGKASLRALLAEPSGHDEVFAEYGAAVASNEDLVIVGAHLHHDPKCDGCGGAFVFRRKHKGKPILIAGEEPGENLGTAVAVSGELVVIGGAGYYSKGRYPGVAVVLRFDGERFRPVCRLRGTSPGEEYGASVAISGNHIVVGATGGRGTPRFTVHEVNGDACVPRGEFSSAGASVAISGKWIAAGQPRFNGGKESSGRVALFRIGADGTIEHRAWLMPRAAAERAFFGAAVAIADKHVFVGAPGTRDDGSAYVAIARL